MDKDRIAEQSQAGWDTLAHYVDVFDQGLDLSIDEDALAAAADIIADVLHGVRRFVATADPEDVIRTALMHFHEEEGER
jgi:hypothetical protein